MPYLIDNKRHLIWNSIQVKLIESRLISEDFIQELEFVFFDPQLFNQRNFEAFNLTEILAYLELSHESYLNVQLPKIENTLEQLCSKFNTQHFSLGLLRLFIERYKTDLTEHILLEDRLLFAFVKDVLKGNFDPKRKRQVITHFLHTHNDNIILALDELKSDLLLLDNDLGNNLAFSVLFDQLEFFQADLMIHGLIEDRVFIQKIINLPQY